MLASSEGEWETLQETWQDIWQEGEAQDVTHTPNPIFKPTELPLLKLSLVGVWHNIKTCRRPQWQVYSLVTAVSIRGSYYNVLPHDRHKSKSDYYPLCMCGCFIRLHSHMTNRPINNDIVLTVYGHLFFSYLQLYFISTDHYISNTSPNAPQWMVSVCIYQLLCTVCTFSPTILLLSCCSKGCHWGWNTRLSLSLRDLWRYRVLRCPQLCDCSNEAIKWAIWTKAGKQGS